MTYADFAKKWLGKRVDADGAFAYQCVDLIRQYIHEKHGAPKTGAWGNAIDYWTRTNSNVLKYFTRVSGHNAKVGDIVVLHGLPGNPYGHIGIATGRSNATQVEILEQNGSTGKGGGTGGDAIRTRFISRSRVAGLLRPKTATAPPAGNTGSLYSVVKRIRGYKSSADAKARKNSNSVVPVGRYRVFNKANGMINITRTAGVPGWWINPGDNVHSAAPAPSPSRLTITVPSGPAGYLGNLAKKYGTTVAQIVAWNKAKYPGISPNRVQAGWRIRVK